MATTIEIKETSVPAIGLGTWQVTGDDCVEAVSDALALGDRHVDTARAYDNEREVGEGLCGLAFARDDIFLTTKVWMDDAGPDLEPRTARREPRRLRLRAQRRGARPDRRAP